MGKFAIQQAKDLGLDSKEAESILKIEEPRQKARKQLVEACQECTMDVLRVAIEHAKKAGLDPEEYAEAESLLAQELEKERLIAVVKRIVDESKSVDTGRVEAMREMKAKLSG